MYKQKYLIFYNSTRPLIAVVKLVIRKRTQWICYKASRKLQGGTKSCLVFMATKHARLVWSTTVSSMFSMSYRLMLILSPLTEKSSWNFPDLGGICVTMRPTAWRSCFILCFTPILTATIAASSLTSRNWQSGCTHWSHKAVKEYRTMESQGFEYV